MQRRFSRFRCGCFPHHASCRIVAAKITALYLPTYIPALRVLASSAPTSLPSTCHAIEALLLLPPACCVGLRNSAHLPPLPVDFTLRSPPEPSSYATRDPAQSRREGVLQSPPGHPVIVARQQCIRGWQEEEKVTDFQHLLAVSRLLRPPALTPRHKLQR